MSESPQAAALGAAVAHWRGAVTPPREPLLGRYCRLEPLDTERHAHSLWRAFAGAEENWRYLPQPPFSEFATYRDWLERAALERDPLFFAIVVDEEAIGVASYLRIVPEQGVIEIGNLNFSPRLSRTPAATQALFLLLKNAFDLGYRRVEWKCDSLNAPSRRAAMRLGFVFEGIFRQDRVVKGHNRDTAWFSIIDTEWPTLAAGISQWLAAENFDASGQQRSSLSTMIARARETGRSSLILKTPPPSSTESYAFMRDKLRYHCDSADLALDLAAGIEDIVVIDTRAHARYIEGHIPGAVSLPHATMDSSTAAALDRAKTYVTYCDGIGCNGSTQGAMKLAALGFQVKELLGGLDFWQRDGHPIERGKSAGRMPTRPAPACGC
ncbi:GNAT family N-acetyltransferase [Halotalea alkalilenta]|uniref:GNAT family N-acetyltransferase n=1 Tax=Halotalea alkalilenta TaxID=376489 RepID=UPI0007D05835|nr:GNAT family N-acetyltransferase [Halotalea alkalilenta]